MKKLLPMLLFVTTPACDDHALVPIDAGAAEDASTNHRDADAYDRDPDSGTASSDASTEQTLVSFRLTPEQGPPGTLVRVEILPAAGAPSSPAVVEVSMGGVRVPIHAIGTDVYLFACPFLHTPTDTLAVHLHDAAGEAVSGAETFEYKNLEWAEANLAALAGTEPGEVVVRTLTRFAELTAEVSAKAAALAAQPGLESETREAISRAGAVLEQLTLVHRELSMLRELEPETFALLAQTPAPTQEQIRRSLRLLDVMLVTSGIAATTGPAGGSATSIEHRIILELDTSEAILLTTREVASLLVLGALASTLVPGVASIAGPAAALLLMLERAAAVSLAVLRVLPTNLDLHPADHLVHEGITVLERVEACPGSLVGVEGTARFVASDSIVASVVLGFIGSRSFIADAVGRQLRGRLSSNTLNVARHIIDHVTDRLATLLAEAALQRALEALRSVPGTQPLRLVAPVAAVDLHETFIAIATSYNLITLEDVLRVAGVNLRAHRSAIGSSNPGAAAPEPDQQSVRAVADGTAEIQLSLVYFSERSRLRFLTFPVVDYGVLVPAQLDVRCVSGCRVSSECLAGEHCDGGSCHPDVCPQGTSFCGGNDRRQCAADGSGSTLLETCNEGCVNGECVCSHECTAGASRCLGSTPQTCETLPSGCRAWTAAATSTELPDYRDNNCDGRIDEDFRITLYRRQASNGFGYSHPSVDADHCFSTSSLRSSGPCIGDQNPGWSYDRDDQDIQIYALWTAQHASVTQVNPDVIRLAGSILLARLASCYHPARTEHELWTTDSAQYAARVTGGWSCTFAGYVKTGALANLDPSEITVRRHQHALASDTMYDVGVGSAQSLGFTDLGPAWFAWRP